MYENKINCHLCSDWGHEKLGGLCAYHFRIISPREREFIAKQTKEKTIINNITTKTMSIIKNLFKSEPEKSFIKAGLLDENEDITSRGKEALSHILWETHKKELKEIADKIIAEEYKK